MVQLKSNFSPVWYHSNDVVVIGYSKEILEDNTSETLFYKAA